MFFSALLPRPGHRYGCLRPITRDHVLFLLLDPFSPRITHMENEHRKGRCVVCGAKGTGDRDFICSRCIDPSGVLMYCERCKTRYSLDSEKALEFLREYGYQINDPSFLVMKVSACSRCLKDGETARIEVFRVHIPSQTVFFTSSDNPENPD